MSWSEYYLFGANGEMIDKLECRNGYGCMPVVWGHYSQLLGMRDYRGHISRLAWLFQMDEMRRKAVRELSPVDRLLLALSWDGVFLPSDLFPALVEGLDRVILSCPPNHVNHWPKVIEWIERERDVEVVGYGHYTTSVNENHWRTKPEPSDDPDVDPWEGFVQRYKKPSEVLHVKLGGEGLGHVQPDGETVWLPPCLRIRE